MSPQICGAPCGTFDLDHHFNEKTERARIIYDKLVDAMKTQIGEFEVVPQKTRICFMTQTRFANCRILKSGLVVNFGLPHLVQHAKIRRAKDEGSNWIVHEVRIEDPAEIDETLLEWLNESRNLMGDRKRFKRS